MDEEFPFNFPEYNDAFASPAAPEHLRILKPQKPRQPTPGWGFAAPSRSPEPAPSSPPAEDDGKVKGDLTGLTEGLSNLDIGKPRVAPPNISSLSAKVLEEGEEWILGQSQPSSPRPLPPLPTLSPPPAAARLPSPPASMPNELRRSRWSAAVASDDITKREWRKRNEAILEATAGQAGLSANEYVSSVAVPIHETFVRRQTEKEEPANKSGFDWADDVEEAEQTPSRTEATKPPKASEPDPVAKPPKPAKAEPEPVVVQAVPPAPKPSIPYREALGKLPQPKPAQPIAPPQPSAAPKAEAAPVRKPRAQDKPVVRPVREDMPQRKQDRVLPLELRQELWARNFQDCEMQEGAEPLQLQIPRSKRDTLLLGKLFLNGERNFRDIFDRLRLGVLPAAVDVVWQDSADNKFDYTLLYIGLKPAWLDNPEDWGPVLALHMAWAMLLPWAKLVSDGYNITVLDWARWYTDNEIQTMRKRSSDMESLMARATKYVEDGRITRDPPAADSHRRAPRAPRPKPGEHQAKMTAERRAENDKLSTIMARAAQTQKAEVVSRVAGIIDGARRDPAGTALDWKALKDGLSQLVVETGEPGSRAQWVYEGCAEWRKKNLPETSEGQVLFDRELNSWYNGFLGFLGMHK